MDTLDALRMMQQELLASDEWLRNKVNPERRLKDHRAYFARNFPELSFGMPASTLLDIGCGPGESLQVVAENGHYGIGIETPIAHGGMGRNYLAYGIRRHILEGLDVKYGPALQVVKKLPEDSVDCVNMRGSFEQIFSEYMIGPPHHEHHKASELAWDVDVDRKSMTPASLAMLVFSNDIMRIMRPGGRIVIHANGSRNHADIKPLVARLFNGKWIEDHLFHGVSK